MPQAANSIVQGTAADLMKYKMVEIDDWLVNTNQEDDIRMLLTIHDSLVFEIKDEILDAAVAKIKHIMGDTSGPPFNFVVPMVAVAKTGKNWEDATYG